MIFRTINNFNDTTNNDTTKKGCISPLNRLWPFLLVIFGLFSSAFAETELKKEVLHRQESPKAKNSLDQNSNNLKEQLTEGLSPSSKSKLSISEETEEESAEEKNEDSEETAEEVSDSEPESSLEDEVAVLPDSAALPDTMLFYMNQASLPCEGNRVTSPYGIRRYRMHKGIDIKVQKGDTIRAAFTGQVSRVSYERRGYGHYVFIEHPELGISKTVYAHLSKKLVKVGQVVQAGEPIGLGGNSGRSTGSHLHFEIRVQNMALNPAIFFNFENHAATQDTLTLSMVEIKTELDAIEKELAKHRYHKIRPGDNLGKIARKYGTSINKICQLNGIKRTTVLRIGRVLRCS
jgi:murein DD-endopeptidase MepM/ murein hydrolase activator NlpD